MQGCNTNTNNNINFELKEFLDVIKINKNLYLEITKVIYTYNANFMRSTNNENVIFVQFLHTTQKLFPELDSIKIISSCFGVWFVWALSQPSGEELAHENFIWKPRYNIIFEVKNLFKNFILQLEFITGVLININNNTKTLVWVLLQTIINHGTLLSKTKQVTKTKTEIFIAGIKINSFFLNQSTLQILYEPAKIISIHNTYYLQTQHYSLLQIIIRPNKASWKKPEITDLSFLQTRLNMKLYINWALLDTILLYAEKHYKFKVSDKICFEQYLNQLKLNWWNIKLQTTYHELFKLRYLLLMREFRPKLENGFYFRDYFDFRGRVYAAGPISYTFNKFTRFLFYYGNYTFQEQTILKQNLPDVSSDIINKILQKTNIQQTYPNININDRIVHYYLFIIFFELGKFKKNTALQQKDGKLNQNEFIDLGINYYDEFFTKTIGFDDFLESSPLIALLGSLNNQIYQKYPIYKDATASAIQLLLVLLGPANSQILKEANLFCDNFWYDTYFWIIKRFLEETVIDSEIKCYFNRNTLKKTIMTYNYQATYQTCLNEFKKASNLPWNNEDPLNKKVLPIFKNFYNFLNKLFESNNYFAISSNTIVQWYKKQWTQQNNINYKTLDNLNVPLAYYKLNKLRLERLILTKRETIKWVELSEEVDEQKMFRAIRANIIHSLDGYLVRSITLSLGYPIITIHDSFGIDILNIPQLIKITQNELTRLSNLNLFNQKLPVTFTYLVEGKYVLL